MEKSVFINNVKFTARYVPVPETNDVVQLFVNDKAVETYECEDKQEADITFNTIRDTLEHISKHALTKF